MRKIPEGSGFRSAWRALTSEERKDLTKIANSGETSEDPEKAALIVALADRRSRPLELVAILIASVLGYVLLGELILVRPEPAVAFGLAVGVAAFLVFQRRRLQTARAKSLEVVRGSAGPQEKSGAGSAGPQEKSGGGDPPPLSSDEDPS